ncbi:MAG: cytochrome c [Thermodesulfobacteriota bacterium]
MKWRLALCNAAALALLAQGALAADGAAMFQEKCGSCHVRGGLATPVNPADKAAVVWGKYFKRGRHRADFSDRISDEELQDIVGYLEEHAADSEMPEAAAIPR